MNGRFHLEYAWIGTLAGGTPRLEADVLVEVADGRFTAVTPGVPAGAAATDGGLRLPGVTLPGLANAHSHAFHRALRGQATRGRTEGRTGSFWTWRDGMYAIADRLDPDTYYRLARAVYAEMALAGITCVGEFHYLHHGAGGVPYADPNAMGLALIQAARDAGIRITLLDTLYLTASVDGAPALGVQQRFSDGTASSWAARVDALSGSHPARQPHVRIGVAAHSVRAVPPDALATVVATAAGRPMHVHLSERRAENDACLATFGRTPTQLLGDHGFLGPSTTAVHATHLADEDRTLLGDTDTAVCFCPTTERDLADGIGPARALVDAGSPLCLGSDSHAVIDMFEEARAVEMHERLRTELRGHFGAAELIAAATLAGHRALGWADAGVIAPGARADLVTVRLDSVRTAAADPAGAAVFAATAADVTHLVVAGNLVVAAGRHRGIDAASELREAVAGIRPSPAPPSGRAPVTTPAISRHATAGSGPAATGAARPPADPPAMGRSAVPRPDGTAGA